MDEFYAFLFAGLAIILGFAILFGGEIVETDTGVGIDTGVETELTTGGNTTTSWRVIKINDGQEFKVGPRSYLLLKKVDTRSGLLFGDSENKLSFEIDRDLLTDLGDVTLTFRVDNTNEYGNLIIKLNGKVVFEETVISGATPKVDITPELLREENIIEVSAASSGWRIWAPTVYQLSDLKLNVELAKDQFPTFTFDVKSTEAEKFMQGRIKYRVEKRIGNLTITLNDVQIYNAQPREHYIYTQDFYANLTRIGKNYLQFRTLDGFATLSEGEVRIYYRK